MNQLFEKISIEYCFSMEQKNQYWQFINFLQVENTKYNLTRIFDTNAIIYHHIIDALEISKYNILDLGNVIYDIGSGAGIPGILLAIFYPNKIFYLNEVTEKKIFFLKNAIILLKLKNCIILSDDFLTVIRRRKIAVDVFIARASIPLNLIIDIYKYKFYEKSKIVYWVGTSWRENKNHNNVLYNKNIIIHEYDYVLQDPDNMKKHIYLLIKKIDKNSIK